MSYKLQISNIHKIFNAGEPNEVYALKNISLNFKSGELVLLTGHNGSGKSTLLNIIDGRIKQTKGEIIIDGNNIDNLKVYQRAKYIYRIFQNTLNGVIQTASIRENMALASKRNTKFKLTSKLVKKSNNALFENIVKNYNRTLSENLDKKIFTLSPGERQAVILSLLEMQKDKEPQILLADEPTASLDPEMAKKSYDAIYNLSKKGWLCLVVTHDENLINGNKHNRIIKFNKGEIVENNKTQQNIYPTWNDLYKYSNVYDLPWVSKTIHPTLKKVIDKLPISNGKALDIGCGLGQVSRYLAKVGYETTGIDISEEAIKLCNQLNDTGKIINYQTANSITFTSDNKYDLIIDFLHIHDIERKDVQKYLKNIDQLLSDKGYFIVSTFSQDDESNKYNNIRESNYVEQKINYYSKEDILNFLTDYYVVVEESALIVGNKNESYKSYILIIKKII